MLWYSGSCKHAHYPLRHVRCGSSRCLCLVGRATSWMTIPSLRSVALTFGDPTVGSKVSHDLIAKRLCAGGPGRSRSRRDGLKKLKNRPCCSWGAYYSAAPTSTGAEGSITMVANDSLSNDFPIAISAYYQLSSLRRHRDEAYGVSSAPMFPAPIVEE